MSLTGKKIQSVQRALDILNCFGAQRSALSLGEISAALGLNKATVHGILSTLQANDYICQDSAGKYLLGHALFEKAVLGQNTKLSLLIDAARRDMQRCSDLFSATANLFLAENNLLHAVHITEPTNSIFVVRRIGSQFPLHACASGKLVLAYAGEDFRHEYAAWHRLERYTPRTIVSRSMLEDAVAEVREDGYAYECEELFEGLSALAVPIFDADRRLYGTVSLSGMAGSMRKNLQPIVSQLRRLARSAEHSLRM